MTTEELIKEGPLAFELEYAELDAHAPVVEHEETADAPAHETEAERQTKKERILALYNAGLTDIAQIVRRVGARPSYVAQVLQQAGHLDGYFALYTTTGREQNV